MSNKLGDSVIESYIVHSLTLFYCVFASEDDEESGKGKVKELGFFVIYGKQMKFCCSTVFSIFKSIIRQADKDDLK